MSGSFNLILILSLSTSVSLGAAQVYVKGVFDGDSSFACLARPVAICFSRTCASPFQVIEIGEASMVDLDDMSIYEQPGNREVSRQLAEFPEQCHRAWERALHFGFPEEYSRISSIVIAGVGGSAIGGDLLSALFLTESKVPLWIHRDYGLPAFVGDNTLVIASSYSGNTEETLAAMRDALRSQVKKLIITSDGQLRSLAESAGIPVFLIDYQAPPRAAFPHNFIPLVGMLQKLGIVSDKTAELQETIEILYRLSQEVNEAKPLALNPAKQLATRLYGRLVVIYGAESLVPVARRWKTQINENSKSWAFFEAIPELNHNAVEGYNFPHDLKEKIFVVLLRSFSIREENLRRYQATVKLLEEAKITHQVVEAKGKTKLSQAMSLVLFGDYVSFYLALLNQTDPIPTYSIDFVKRYLGGAWHEGTSMKEERKEHR